MSYRSARVAAINSSKYRVRSEPNARPSQAIESDAFVYNDPNLYGGGANAYGSNPYVMQQPFYGAPSAGYNVDMMGGGQGEFDLQPLPDDYLLGSEVSIKLNSRTGAGDGGDTTTAKRYIPLQTERSASSGPPEYSSAPVYNVKQLSQSDRDKFHSETIEESDNLSSLKNSVLTESWIGRQKERLKRATSSATANSSVDPLE